ncbi:hypothetical protein CU044_7660 [Streptomyces sp. L-9-10]|nr:hypothetical protein CU044_7660 [Streptomyces sp. L-9-10]
MVFAGDIGTRVATPDPMGSPRGMPRSPRGTSVHRPRDEPGVRLDGTGENQPAESRGG